MLSSDPQHYSFTYCVTFPEKAIFDRNLTFNKQQTDMFINSPIALNNSVPRPTSTTQTCAGNQTPKWDDRSVVKLSHNVRQQRVTAYLNNAKN